MKTNYHTHSTWCDGADSPRRMVEAAIGMGFDTLGFSSHSMLPENDTDWVLTPEKAPRYAADIRSLAAEFQGRIRVMCGVEADYIPGGASPDRDVYAAVAPDYVIGSVHFVTAADGARVAVDHEPRLLEEGIREHFGGEPESFIKSYFAQEREMVEKFDFDVVGHPDLVRKFNVKNPYFDERAGWYLEEVERTAAAIARSGKIVEVNTGAISRGWLDDAYPAEGFRRLLRDLGVKFVLSSDAHFAAALDCGFDRFGKAEDFIELADAKGGAR